MTVLFGFEPEVVWISMDLTPIRFESDYSAFGFSFSRNRKPAKSTLPGCIPKRVQVPTQNRTVAEPLGPNPKSGGTFSKILYLHSSALCEEELFGIIPMKNFLDCFFVIAAFA